MNSTIQGQPLVSVGMPVYNCEKTLAAAVRSILNQTYPNWEILIIDDGSSDKTVEIGRSFKDPRVRMVADGRHMGIPRRRNQTIERSRGDYYALLDGDDVAYPERLERQVRYLREHPEIDLVGCSMLMFKNDGVPFGCRPLPGNHDEICRKPSSGFHIAHGTLMGPVSWFRAHPYDAGTARAEDYDLLLRSHTTSRFACLCEILYGCREDRLLLRKILVGRYGVARAAARGFLRKRKYVVAAGAVLKQFAKAHVDIFAVLSGLDYHVLAHRAQPLRGEDAQRWGEVWGALHQQKKDGAKGVHSQEWLCHRPV